MAAGNKEERLSMGRSVWAVLKQSSFWLVIFTGLLTLFTYKLWEVTRLSTESTRSAQRALMNFGGLSIGPKFTDQN